MEPEESTGSFRAAKEIQQAINAVTATRPPENEGDLPPSMETAQFGNTPDAHSSSQNVHQKQERHYWRKSVEVQWCLFFATFAAFGAAMYYAYVAASQKETMDRTFDAIVAQGETMQSAVRAAQEANKITRHDLEAFFTFRAGIISEYGMIGELGPLDMTVEPPAGSVLIEGQNIGRSRASAILVRVCVRVRDIVTWKQFPFAGPACKVLPVNSVEAGAPLQRSRISLPDVAPVHSGDISAIRSFLERALIVIDTEMSYDMGMGERKTQHFCYAVVPVNWDKVNLMIQFSSIDCGASEDSINMRRKALGAGTIRADLTK